jgi:hypothetical protein
MPARDGRLSRCRSESILETRREHPMRKAKLVFNILGTFIFSLGAFCTAPAQTDFSGTWVLDKEKTRNLPSQLEGYTMVVTQSEQQLTVETKVEGDLRPPARESGESSPRGGGFPGGAGGGGFPGGPSGGGFPGGPGGGGFPGGGPPSGLMALGMVIPSATYSLDGKETTAELEGPMPGTATLKAKWAKDQKVLELTAVRHLDFQGNSVTFTSKERWKLSEDGQEFKLERTVETPRGTDSVKLVFRKEQGERPSARE